MVQFFLLKAALAHQNVCIIAPTGTCIERMARMLSESGYESGDLRDSEFFFHRRDVSKLSTEQALTDAWLCLSQQHG